MCLNNSSEKVKTSGKNLKLVYSQVFILLLGTPVMCNLFYTFVTLHVGLIPKASELATAWQEIDYKRHLSIITGQNAQIKR